MYYFIRDKGTRNLWHTILGLVKIKGDSFHHKKTEVSGHQETKKQPKDFTVPLFPVKYNPKQCSYFPHTASCPLPKEGLDPMSQLFWGLHWSGWVGRWRAGGTQTGFALLPAASGASVWAVKQPSLRQKPVETSSLTLLVWHNEGQISLHYLLENE